MTLEEMLNLKSGSIIKSVNEWEYLVINNGNYLELYSFSYRNNEFSNLSPIGGFAFNGRNAFSINLINIFESI